MLKISENCIIPDTELAMQFARSSGPGGQNVNKVNSKAQLSWYVESSESIPADVKTRFLNKFGNKLTNEGAIVISSDSYRDQKRNAQDCEEKLREMLLSVWQAPKKRRPTKPTAAGKAQRLQTKKIQSDRKKTRGKVDY